ncbi:heavy metal-responsive transcriptional regulator [Sulfobacillus thermosulfidooxidans]|uniref:heavy metal-responsive transcriptional regulator n=1 Tax=Sulfobacillus thermosulfidooxidans TaxID=28034 RepID=UPI0006B6870D|nr:heavy metal-responsive transcriptional regulator [Sulfobacillus thermosulfidooxidans]
MTRQHDTMRIGELAKVAGITPKTLRYYEDFGLLPASTRSESGYRLYSWNDLDRLRFIQKAKTVGFSLSEIRSILALRNHGEVPCDHVKALINRKLEEINSQIQALRDLEIELRTMQKEADALPPCEACVCEIIEHHDAMSGNDMP